MLAELADSLLATRLVSRMRDTFQLDLPVRLFFERSTVVELAEAVEGMVAEQHAPSRPLTPGVPELLVQPGELLPIE